MIHLVLQKILDDRAESAGFRFTEAELIGYPYTLVVGQSFTKEKKIEVWVRQTGDKVCFEFDIFASFYLMYFQIKVSLEEIPEIFSPNGALRSQPLQFHEPTMEK